MFHLDASLAACLPQVDGWRWRQVGQMRVKPPSIGVFGIKSSYLLDSSNLLIIFN